MLRSWPTLIMSRSGPILILLSVEWTLAMFRYDLPRLKTVRGDPSLIMLRTVPIYCISYVTEHLTYPDCAARWAHPDHVDMNLPWSSQYIGQPALFRSRGTLSWPWWVGCPWNNQFFFPDQTETNRNSICFGCFSVCFAKPNKFFWICFGLFQCFVPVSKQPKQTKKIS